MLTVAKMAGNRHILARVLSDAGFATRSAESGADVDRILEAAGDIAAALIDLTGFDRRIWIVCDRLHDARVPFVVVATRWNRAQQRTSLTHGARALLVKPVSVTDLVGHLHALIEQ